MSIVARLEQRLRRDMAGRVRSAPRWSEHVRMFDAAYLIVQVFYFVTAMQFYGGVSSVSRLSGKVENYDFLWPLYWMNYVSLETSGYILANAYVIVGMLSVFLWRFLIIRIAVCLVLLQFTALPNSFGSIGHGYHEWFWLSVCFLFLPSQPKHIARSSRLIRTKFLYAFSIAPALVLFFYTLSGFYKVSDATVRLITGQYGGFMPDAMAQTVARRSLETLSDPIWAGLVTNYPMLGWPFYLSLYYIEIVAIFIFFRPSLHRVWGCLLIAFHLGTAVFMDIAFNLHVLINGMLFIASPFAPDKMDLSQMVRELPFLGRFLGGASQRLQRFSN